MMSSSLLHKNRICVAHVDELDVLLELNFWMLCIYVRNLERTRRWPSKRKKPVTYTKPSELTTSRERTEPLQRTLFVLYQWACSNDRVVANGRGCKYRYRPSWGSWVVLSFTGFVWLTVVCWSWTLSCCGCSDIERKMRILPLRRLCLHPSSVFLNFNSTNI